MCFPYLKTVIVSGSEEEFRQKNELKHDSDDYFRER